MHTLKHADKQIILYKQLHTCWDYSYQSNTSLLINRITSKSTKRKTVCYVQDKAREGLAVIGQNYLKGDGESVIVDGRKVCDVHQDEVYVLNCEQSPHLQVEMLLYIKHLTEKFVCVLCSLDGFYLLYELDEYFYLLFIFMYLFISIQYRYNNIIIIIIIIHNFFNNNIIMLYAVAIVLLLNGYIHRIQIKIS